MKFKLCNIKVDGNVEQPIHQTLIINLKWLAIAIVLLVIAAAIFSWWCHSSDSERYWLTESTGRIHKEGCIYYQKTKGHFVTGRKDHLLCRRCFGIPEKKDKRQSIPVKKE